MAEAVIQPDEIALNGVHYRIDGPVATQLASVYSPKTIIGEYTLESRPRVSVRTWNDWRGGLGLNREREKNHNQFWYGTCETSFHRHLTLVSLWTAAATDAGVTTIYGIGELGGKLYVQSVLDIYPYTVATNTWGAVVHTMSNPPLSIVTAVLSGTRYLIIGQVNKYTYSSDGASFTDVAKDSDRLAVWNDLLWGIDDTGQLWYSSNPTVTPTNGAKVPLSIGSVNSLFVGMDATGETILYAGTTEGLFAHDFANERFLPTGLQWPHLPNSGFGCVWNGAIYVGYGVAGVWEYAPGRAEIRNIGPTLNDGLPANYKTWPRQLLPSFRDLLLVVQPGYEALPLAWDGIGWRVIRSDDAVEAAFISALNSTYRLYADPEMALGLGYLPLRTDSGWSPATDTTKEYAAAGYHELAWFSPSEPDVTSTALDVTLETVGVGGTTPTTDETVVVKYRLNYSTGAWTTLGTITCEAFKTTTYQFPNDSTPTGTDFKAIQFRLELARGSAGSNPQKKSPDVISIVLAYRKKLAEKWRFGVTIDGFEPISTNTPETLMAAVRTAIGSTTKVEFTFRDSAKPTGQVFYVDVVSAELMEQTGLDERSRVKLVLEEL